MTLMKMPGYMCNTGAPHTTPQKPFFQRSKSDAKQLPCSHPAKQDFAHLGSSSCSSSFLFSPLALLFLLLSPLFLFTLADLSLLSLDVSLCIGPTCQLVATSFRKSCWQRTTDKVWCRGYTPCSQMQSTVFTDTDSRLIEQTPLAMSL